MKLIFISLGIASLVLVVVGVVSLSRQKPASQSTISPPPNPVATTLTPTVSPPPYRLGAWIPWWDEAAALQSLDQARSRLDSISPVWYQLHRNGQVVPTTSTHKAAILQTAQTYNYQVIVSLSNADSTGFNSQAVTDIVTQPELKHQVINHLLTLAKQHQYAGWDLDLEEVLIEDKPAFSQFVNQLAAALHANGLLLHVTVHAQTGSHRDWQGALGQDWVALSQSADKLVVMAYDYHYASSDPGPVTPLSWLNQVIRHAQQQVAADKLIIALPTYGYDWPQARPGFSITFAQAQNLIAEYQLTPRRDPVSQALRFVYLQNNLPHQVWYEDHHSITHKINQIHQAGIDHIYLWSLGGEDVVLWETI